MPDYYITFSRVCQEVFQKFFNFFRDSFSGLSFALALGDRSLTAQLPDSLHIIALSFPFVKRFLTSFFSLGLSLVCHKNVVAELCTMHNEPYSKERVCRSRPFSGGDQSSRRAQKPFSPAVLPWGSKQWNATARLRFRSAQTPCPYIPPPAITPSASRAMPYP